MEREKERGEIERKRDSKRSSNRRDICAENPDVLEVREMDG